MLNIKGKRSHALIGLQAFLAIGALAGGTMLITDPSGELIGMPSSLLQDSFFPDYLIPGILLFCVFGILPLITASGLILKWEWDAAQRFNIFKEKHWSWTFSLYSGFELIIWIMVQVYILDSVSFIHLVYAMLGLMIQMATILPSVQAKYTMQ